MRKKLLIGGGIGLLVLFLLGGSGFGYWKYHEAHQPKVASAVTYAGNSSNGTTELQPENANSSSTPLSNQQQAGSSPLANNQGNSLQTNVGQQQSSSSSGSSSSPLDPSKFGQYDQYVNGTSARFAELKTGDGATAVAGKKAVVVYKGWLTNGTLFDESKKDPKTGKFLAFSFVLSDGSQPSSVIAGWQQGIAGMKVGGERLLIIPPAVGYGSAAHNPIPANSVLVFDVLLVAVQ